MVRQIKRKYFLPTSLTWWASVSPLVIGAFMALEPVHGLTAWVQAVSAMTGDMAPYALINMGLVGIGLRGAVQ